MSAVLRFKPRRRESSREVRWPDFKAEKGLTSFSEGLTPFSPRPPLPQLTVAIDHEILVDADEERLTKLSVLCGLLSHDYITLLRYSDDGPPPDAERVPHPRRGETTPGWIVVAPMAERSVHQQVTAAFGHLVLGAAIFADPLEAAEADANPSYDELSEPDARVRRRADAMAVQAADAVEVDLYITKRPYLHEVTWDLTSGVLVARPDDALPLVSLYLRSQGVFIQFRSLDGNATWELNKGMFYLVGTREFLPEGWRWFAACVQHDGTGHEAVYLGQSVFRRVQRALEARDDVLRALNQPQHKDTAEEALTNLDLAMLALMGAIDATARVAHRALGLTSKERYAGWQNDGWLSEVRKKAPGLAAAFAPETEFRRGLSILTTLRNTIHGAALAPVGLVEDRKRRPETFVGLPEDKTTALMEAMDELGGLGSWGVRELVPGRLHADPGVLLDRILILSLELLNGVMRLTPVEQLTGVSLSEADAKPPASSEFDEHTRTSIRWQLGLDHVP